MQPGARKQVKRNRTEKDHNPFFFSFSSLIPFFLDLLQRFERSLRALANDLLLYVRCFPSLGLDDLAVRTLEELSRFGIAFLFGLGL